MKIYFAGSIRGGRQDAELYRKVIAALKDQSDIGNVRLYLQLCGQYPVGSIPGKARLLPSKTRLNHRMELANGLLCPGIAAVDHETAGS